MAYDTRSGIFKSNLIIFLCMLRAGITKHVKSDELGVEKHDFDIKKRISLTAPQIFHIFRKWSKSKLITKL